MSNKITFKTYEYLVCLGDEVVRMETSVLPQENTNTLEQETAREIIQHPREAESSAQEDWVSALARQFGGTVLPDTPIGEQGRLDETQQRKLGINKKNKFNKTTKNITSK